MDVNVINNILTLQVNNLAWKEQWIVIMNIIDISIYIALDRGIESSIAPFAWLDMYEKCNRYKSCRLIIAFPVTLLGFELKSL